MGLPDRVGELARSAADCVYLEGSGTTTSATLQRELPSTIGAVADRHHAIRDDDPRIVRAFTRADRDVDETRSAGTSNTPFTSVVPRDSRGRASGSSLGKNAESAEAEIKTSAAKTGVPFSSTTRPFTCER